MVNQQVHPPFNAWLFKCCHCCVFPDNVHFQQAAEISEALVEEQVDFEAMVSNQDNRRRNHRNPSFVLDLADEMCIKHWTFCLLGLNISRILMNFLCFLPVVHGQGPRARRRGVSTPLQPHDSLPAEVLCVRSTGSIRFLLTAHVN